MATDKKEHLIQVLIKEKDLNKKLIQSTEYEVLEMVKYSLSKGAEKETINEKGETPLFMAASAGAIEIVKYLVTEDCDMEASDKNGKTPLISAALNGKLEVVQYLVLKNCEKEATDSEGRTALMMAASTGQMKIVMFLLARGCDIFTVDKNNRTATAHAIENHHVGVERFMIGYENPNPLFDPFEDMDGKKIDLTKDMDEKTNLMRDMDEKTYLIKEMETDEKGLIEEMNAKKNYYSMEEMKDEKKSLINTLYEERNLNWRLIRATVHKQLDMIKLCIRRGAEKESKNMLGRTPLLIAADTGILSIVEYLITVGCNKNARQNDGSTPLIKAASNGHIEVVKYLVTIQCEKDKTDYEGRTPLMMAAAVGHLTIVTYLVIEDCDTEAKDNEGNSALALAIRHKRIDVVQWLKNNEQHIKGRKAAPTLVVEHKRNDVEKLLLNEGEHMTTDAMRVITKNASDSRETQEVKDDTTDDDSGHLTEGETTDDDSGHLTEEIKISVAPRDRSKVIPQKWMLFFNTIDSELPSSFKWIHGNGDPFEVLKNYNRYLVKKLFENQAEKEDSGIYQCVRTFEDKKEDVVNVVLHVSEVCPTLRVHPNSSDYQVEWRFRSSDRSKYKTLNNKSETSLRLTKPKRNVGYKEYKCTVTFPSSPSTQTYFFVVDQSLLSDKKRKEVFGVPSNLSIKEEFLYFAYGSNLLTERLNSKNKDPKFETTALLKDYKLEFISMTDPKGSKWRGGVANIIPSKGEEVYGAVYKLGVQNIPSLDRQEGFYEAVKVDVINIQSKETKEIITCRTYLVDPSRVPKEFDPRPSFQYKDIIIRGAICKELPKEYIQKIQSIKFNDNKEIIEEYDKTLAKIKKV